MTKIELVFSYGNVIVKSSEDILYCMNLMLRNLNPYSPRQVFLENINKIMEIAYELSELLQEEFRDEDKKAFGQLSKFKTKLTNLRKSTDYIKTKDDALKLQYNILLSFEGLGLLNGFGAVTKFGDKIDYFNPERNSIVNLT
jgi:hypothetical protein